LPPFAAGANPMITTRGDADPQPGTGRPQYGCPANALRLVTATSSRQVTRRGQARQTDERAVSSVRSAEAANSWTSAGVRATGVSGAAGSSGQPLPGSTGLVNIAPVIGCGSRGPPVEARSSATPAILAPTLVDHAREARW